MSNSVSMLVCVFLSLSIFVIACIGRQAFEDHDKDCPFKFPNKVPDYIHLPLICENSQQFKVKGTCDKENCSKCIPPTSTIMLEEKEEIKEWQALYEKTKKSRREELKNLLSSHNIQPSDEEPIILMVINRGYLYLFYNFVCSLEYNKIEGVRERILVIPTDEETQKDISLTGIMSYYPSWLGENYYNE